MRKSLAPSTAVVPTASSAGGAQRKITSSSSSNALLGGKSGPPTPSASKTVSGSFTSSAKLSGRSTPKSQTVTQSGTRHSDEHSGWLSHNGGSSGRGEIDCESLRSGLAPKNQKVIAELVQSQIAHTAHRRGNGSAHDTSALSVALHDDVQSDDGVNSDRTAPAAYMRTSNAVAPAAFDLSALTDEALEQLTNSVAAERRERERERARAPPTPTHGSSQSVASLSLSQSQSLPQWGGVLSAREKERERDRERERDAEQLAAVEARREVRRSLSLSLSLSLSHSQSLQSPSQSSLHATLLDEREREREKERDRERDSEDWEVCAALADLSLSRSLSPHALTLSRNGVAALPGAAATAAAGLSRGTGATQALEKMCGGAAATPSPSRFLSLSLAAAAPQSLQPVPQPLAPQQSTPTQSLSRSHTPHNTLPVSVSATVTTTASRASSRERERERERRRRPKARAPATRGGLEELLQAGREQQAQHSGRESPFSSSSTSAFEERSVDRSVGSLSLASSRSSRTRNVVSVAVGHAVSPKRREREKEKSAKHRR